MRKLALIGVAGITAGALLATPGLAGLPGRTFVSGRGDDNNPCTRTAPCRSLERALIRAAFGGEITVLDSAGYGSFTIRQPISITATGVEAAITTNSPGDAITINAGPNDVINLSGLNLNGGGVGNNGITFNSGGFLNIRNCVVRGFTENGINLVPGASTTTVSDTIVSNNGTNGVIFAPREGYAASYFKRIQAHRNGAAGFIVSGNLSTPAATITATAEDFVSIGNANGFTMNGGGSVASPTLLLINSQAFNNNYGLVGLGFPPQGSMTMTLTQSAVFGNSTYGFFLSNATIKTFGDNYIADANNVGSLASPPLASQ